MARSGKNRCQGMQSLTQRNRGPKGLDTSLPPLSNINEIFSDITKKANTLGLDTVLKHLPTRPLRIATCCSGTESPLLALQMIQESLPASTTLQFEHVFSVEIVPYKQAYIERNFAPAIIFRDVQEMTEALDDDVPMATTAYGSRVPIPLDIDILIAGTGCPDFSNLNSQQKPLQRGSNGVSSRTFYAVLDLVKKFRPLVVLIENIIGAPWAKMIQEYEDLGYGAAGVLVDTKDYYIPQTRQRGYMACFDKARMNNSAQIAAEWQTLMAKFRRFASSPVTAFLTSSHESHLEDLFDEPSRSVDWLRCLIRHTNYREGQRLGHARPFTKWQASGYISVPEGGSATWYKKQTERVKDTIECSILRKALPKHGAYDARFKTRIFNLSQNIDREEDTGQFGISTCITPSGIFFVSDAGRILTPEETLKLQGIPLSKISFTTETAAEIQDLAGNAMTSTVIGSAIISAIIATGTRFTGHNQQSQDVDESITAASCATSDRQDLVAAAGLLSQLPEELTSTFDHNKYGTLAAASSRKCLCREAHGRQFWTILQCRDCSHTACPRCGGNPKHTYDMLTISKSDRIHSTDFTISVRRALPLHLSFKKGFLARPGLSMTDMVSCAYDEILVKALGERFSTTSISRTTTWTIRYASQSADLDLTFMGYRAA